MSKARKTNRIAINLEDTVYEAFINLAEKEGISTSELGRQVIISELMKLELIPTESIKKLVGVRV